MFVGSGRYSPSADPRKFPVGSTFVGTDLYCCIPDRVTLVCACALRFVRLLQLSIPERCPSGLRSTLGKRVLGKPNRGFESHPLRHTSFNLCFTSTLTPRVCDCSGSFYLSQVGDKTSTTISSALDVDSHGRLVWSRISPLFFRGAPHAGFSAGMRKIKSRTSLESHSILCKMPKTGCCRACTEFSVATGFFTCVGLRAPDLRAPASSAGSDSRCLCG
jgi:hypothetical protein